MTTDAKSPAKKSASKPGWRVAAYVVAALIWVAVSVIASQLIIGNIMIAILGAETLVQPEWSATYSALSYILAMLLIIFVPPRVMMGLRITNDKTGKVTHKGVAPSKTSREALGLKGWPTWTDIGLAPVGFFVYLLIAAGLTALFMFIPGFDAGEAQDIGFSLTLTGVDRIIAFITLVVVAPIAEEIIFRGWLYGKLRNKLSGQMPEVAGMVISILLVSLLFGAVHMQWNVGVNVFAMSVVACLLREFTGTIYSGMLLHAIKNGVAFYLLYVLGMG